MKAGGILIENAIVTEVDTNGGIHTVTADEFNISAANLIYVTHLPPGIIVFNFRCVPYRSYVLAVSLTDEQFPDVLVYDMQEPYHYFRTREINGERLLLSGGVDHKTGHDDPEQAFFNLEAYIRKYFNVAELNTNGRHSIMFRLMVCLM